MKTPTVFARRLLQEFVPTGSSIDRAAVEEAAGAVDRYVEAVARKAYGIAQKRAVCMETPAVRIRGPDIELAAGCVQSSDEALFRFVLGAVELATAVSDRRITRPELRDMAIDFLEEMFFEEEDRDDTENDGAGSI